MKNPTDVVSSMQTVQLSEGELRVLCNALGEALGRAELTVWKDIGLSPTETEEMYQRLSSALDELTRSVSSDEAYAATPNAVVALRRADVDALTRAISSAVAAIAHDAEFKTLIGATPEEAKTLGDRLIELDRT
jgi:hypothetical protein